MRAAVPHKSCDKLADDWVLFLGARADGVAILGGGTKHCPIAAKWAM
jgi:hypothetical protein